MTCPRCGRALIRSHDELFCPGHGTIIDPVRAHDAIEEPGPQSSRPVATMSGRPWSIADRAYVVRNADLMSARAMGEELGRTERAVHHLLSKMGHPKVRVSTQLHNSGTVPKSPAREMEDVEDMIRPGTVAAMARRLGLTYVGLHSRLRRRGIRVREADGMLSVCDVMRLYGCTKRRVYHLLSRNILQAERAPAGFRIDPASAEANARLLRARSRHDPRRRAPR